MFDVIMHRCAKHASEYRQEQAGTTWGQQRERSSQVLPLDSGNLDASENILLGKNTITYPTVPHKRRPLIYMHTGLVPPYQSPTLYDAGISQPMTCIIARSCCWVAPKLWPYARWSGWGGRFIPGDLVSVHT